MSDRGTKSQLIVVIKVVKPPFGARAHGFRRPSGTKKVGPGTNTPTDLNRVEIRKPYRGQNQAQGVGASSFPVVSKNSTYRSRASFTGP